MDVEEQAEMEAAAEAPPVATADELTTKRLPTDHVDVTINGQPRRVHVRALSRFEVLAAQQREERLGTLAMERIMLHRGMLDPAMGEAQVTDWQKAAPAGEIEPVINKVAELSGMVDDAAKVAYKSNGGQPDA